MKDTVDALNTKGKVAKCGGQDGDLPWQRHSSGVHDVFHAPDAATPLFDRFIGRRFSFHCRNRLGRFSTGEVPPIHRHELGLGRSKIDRSDWSIFDQIPRFVTR